MIVLYGFVLFNLKDTRTNAATWFILAYGDGLDFWSYLHMTNAWWLNFVPLAFALGSIATFVVCLVKKRFGNIWGLFQFWRWNRNGIEPLDRMCLIGDLIITILWVTLVNAEIRVTIESGAWLQNFDAATVANLGYQLTAVIVFLPMWWSQLCEREIEDPAPWLVWSLAFLVFAVLMAFESGKWQELVYPTVNLFTHFMLGITALTVIARIRTRTTLSFQAF